MPAAIAAGRSSAGWHERLDRAAARRVAARSRIPSPQAHGTDLKALIPVGGVPMVARPAAALLAAPEIERVRVLAQQPERIAAVLPDDPRLSVEPSGATIAATLDAILRRSRDPLSACW